jgi:hypothetical protein
MQTMSHLDRQALLPITNLEFGFHHLNVEVTARVVQAFVAKFDILASVAAKWEMSECDGSPSIRFDLSQSPWLIERESFRPVIDAMYKECVEITKSMERDDGAKTKFRCISVDFTDDPCVGNALKTIFNID